MGARLAAGAKKAREPSRATDRASQIAAIDLFVVPDDIFKVLYGLVIPLHGRRRATTSSPKSVRRRNWQTSKEEIAARRPESAAHDFEALLNNPRAILERRRP
jgi:hypothetical protein